MLGGVGPVAVASFLPLLHHQVFEDFGLVNACDKLRDCFVVGDVDFVLLGIVLSSCEVAGVYADISVRGALQGAVKAAFVAILLALVIMGHVRR